MHEALAYPLIGAFVAAPQLLVMDRPPPVYARQIFAVTSGTALLTTHADAAGEARVSVVSSTVGRPSFALLQARLYVARRFVFYACVGAAVAAFLAPAGVPFRLFVCGALGIVAALEQTPGTTRHLDRCEQSAPLFGRQLARAKALVPCAAAVAAVALYALVASVRGLHGAGSSGLMSGIAVIATTLVALSASLRTGWSRALYIVAACAVSGTAYGLSISAPYGILVEMAFCAIVAFIALRQYGETLARYDPV